MLDDVGPMRSIVKGTGFSAYVHKLGHDAARELQRELELEEAEREAAARARASKRGDRAGLRKRANRGRRRDAPRAPRARA